MISLGLVVRPAGRAGRGSDHFFGQKTLYLAACPRPISAGLLATRLKSPGLTERATVLQCVPTSLTTQHLPHHNSYCD